MSEEPKFSIRRARREDCAGMMALVRELAAFERAPEQVTVSLAEFERCGFGERPIWWAFVAVAGGMGQALEEQELSVPLSENEAAESLGSELVSGELEALEPDTPLSAAPPQDGLPVGPVIQLPEPVEPALPEAVREALPLMQDLVPSEEIIGMALYYIRYSTWKGPRLYLEDLIVTESWRCRGVGTALMEALIAEAKAGGWQGISWQVLEWNKAAVKFYELFGARFDAEWVNGALDV
jgi:GNAT superfamily N-acetyltransferase